MILSGTDTEYDMSYLNEPEKSRFKRRTIEGMKKNIHDMVFAFNYMYRKNLGLNRGLFPILTWPRKDIEGVDFNWIEQVIEFNKDTQKWEVVQ